MTLEEDRDQLAQEAKALWVLLHAFVESHRVSGELNHPGIYKAYDLMCEECGETPRQVKIDTSKQK